MSELRVALVAEGTTDRVIIESALKAILSTPFTLALLQPEPTHPKPGGGWCGVFKWCRAFAARTQTSLESDPTLPDFDLFVIQVDADVAEDNYAAGGEELAAAAQGLPSLPCSKPCPPPADTADEVRTRILAWLGLSKVGPKTVLCVPSKASEAWLAAGLCDEPHRILNGLECNLNLEAQLKSLPLKQRIKKNVREYSAHSVRMARQWDKVTSRCSQAQRFATEVLAAASTEQNPLHPEV